jgi:hypothetical protein
VQTLHRKGFPVFTFSDGRLSDYDNDQFDLQTFEDFEHNGTPPSHDQTIDISSSTMPDGDFVL